MRRFYGRCRRFVPLGVVLVALLVALGGGFAAGWRYGSDTGELQGYRFGNHDGYAVGYNDGLVFADPDPSRFMTERDYALRARIGGREIGE